MNLYPSWIQRISQIIEALSLLPDERIDRRKVEELFDLRHTAAHRLLERSGAELCGHSRSLDKLTARLREMQEHPNWRWEREHKSMRTLRLCAPASDARWCR